MRPLDSPDVVARAIAAILRNKKLFDLAPKWLQKLAMR
jgi:hypothetical protein